MNILERVFFRRPRILNLLHIVGLVGATSQTNEIERKELARHAAGAKCALEIGAFQGVSTGTIATALDSAGKLYCVDPWSDFKSDLPDPCYQIFSRHLARRGLLHMVIVLRGYSSQVVDRIPNDLDFIFVDGDHSWEGIEADWAIVRSKLSVGGKVCLHDTATPESEPWRILETVSYFETVISKDPEFRLVDTVHSMNVLQRCG